MGKKREERRENGDKIKDEVREEEKVSSCLRNPNQICLPNCLAYLHIPGKHGGRGLIIIATISMAEGENI